jgi:DNA primase
LLASPEGLRYLIQQRGLTLETIQRYELGYDERRHAITFPARDEDGALVNVRHRFLSPGADPKVIGLARPAVLYPDVPHDGALLLVAGEIDALTGRQNGLPTITTTCGTALPDHLAQRLAGRKVFVMYDVGEEAAAGRSVAKLRELGSPAITVELRSLGLPDKADLNDYYRQGGKTKRLRALIWRQARREA